MNYLIKKNDAGKRLDKFLAEKMKDTTRSQIQKTIEGGLIFVNGKIAKKHLALEEKDRVEIKKAKKEKASSFKLTPEIIFENNEFLVLNKPAGLIVHGAPHIKQPTLADWLIKKYPGLKKIGEDQARPGIMHRLDKEASGLLVVAKTNDCFFNLKKQFQEREVGKKYIALVYGVVSQEEGQINFPIKRSSDGFRQAAVPPGYKPRLIFKESEETYFEESPREALTEFAVKKRFKNYTLLEVRIKSGRKHQIRVHFHALGAPLVGDNIYATRRTRELNKKNGLNRIFLAAVNLSFKDLSGKKQEFSLPLPQELEEFLKKIK